MEILCRIIWSGHSLKSEGVIANTLGIKVILKPEIVAGREGE